MPTAIELIPLSCMVVFWFGFGWHFCQVARLWGTTEYGGSKYIGHSLKAAAFSIFLFAAAFLADYFGISEARRNVGALVSIPFAALGCIVSLIHHRRRNHTKPELL